jgi:hypothetical protein
VRWARAFIGVVWAGAVLAGTSAQAQISPGPLAAPHASLEGTLKCGNCHGGRKEQTTALCLQCHKEIAWLVQQGRGYHAQVREQRCESCHPEHAGRSFSLISWPGGSARQFDHAKAGWSLEGKHGATECTDCHKPAFRVSQAAQLSPPGGNSPGWVGLEQSCTSCHRDVHRGALNHDCLTCHDEAHWKPAPRFNHDRTDYPLTGKHRDVGCGDCHRPVAGTVARDTASAPRVFKPVAHADCVACHADPHRGRFAGACRDCHVTTGFGVIDRGHFDHSRTRFPLRGQHAEVACAKCHDVPGQASRNPPFATCTACHADPHAGTATLAGAQVDCDACHTEAGFKVAGFTVAQHGKTRYPLEGRHRQVSCEDCHRKNPPGVPVSQLGSAGVVMHPSFARCLDCHSDDHGGQFASRTDRGDCTACHTVAGWKPSTFTTAAHAALRLRLDGRHAEIACAACHGPTRSGLAPLPAAATLGKAGVAFHLTELDCVACHIDPHRGRFAAGGAHPVPQGCLGCHTTSGYRPSTIDVAAHARYGFTLEGAHRAVPCVGCHAELKYPEIKSSLVRNASWSGAPLLFTTTSQACSTCHASPHGRQFAARPDGGKCESCHGVDAFKPAARFDHDRDTKFPLRGGHATVPCAKCHPTEAGPGNTRVIRYRPVSGRCENCHGDGVRQ